MMYQTTLLASLVYCWVAVTGLASASSECSIVEQPEAGAAFLQTMKQKEEACAIPAGMTKARTKEGFEMVVFADKDIVSDSIRASGTWEIPNAAKMASRVDAQLPSDGVFLDIGANLGYYSFLFAHQGWQVLAVEAMDRNRAAMNATLCLNPEFASRVTIVATALAAPWQSEGMSCVVKSTNSDINVGNGALSCGKDARCYNFDRGNCQPVALKTLDTVLSEQAPPRIDVVKMDVEAFECFVLQGGESLFTNYLPELMQVETQWSNTSTCVANVATKHGYTSHSLGPDTTLVQLTKLRKLSKV